MGSIAQQIAATVIRPVVLGLGLDGGDLQAAGELLLGTGLQESGLIYRRQLDGGPSLGLFQMEPSTHHDIWANFLVYRPNLALAVKRVAAPGLVPNVTLLETDDRYAAAMCRVQYLRMGQIVGQVALPAAGDVEAMAGYWKRFYNTAEGAGTIAEWIANWQASDAAACFSA